MVGLRQAAGPPVELRVVVPRATPAGRSAWPVAALGYLILGFVIWWHAWAHGPASSLPQGSVDPIQSVWFLGWAAHALSHGTSPIFTRAMYAPQGVNLLDNTSTLALGVALWPLTSVFNPIVSFNVAVVLAPSASALATYFAASRYVTYRPAAFIAGLCYGFGPFLATDLQLGHLNLTFSPVPPLVLLCLDELLVTQRRSPRVVGAGLGALLVVQFFISTEVLAIMMVVALVALALLALARPAETRGRLSSARPALVVTAAIVAVALSYPAWFAIFGPEHVAGPVFGSTSATTSTLWALISPHGGRPAVGFISGGNGSYLGVPMLAVVGLGWLLWRRPPALAFFSAMAAACFVLSLGPSLHASNADTHIPLPEAILAHTPLLWSIMPSRFGIFVDLFAALCLGIVLDRLRHGDLGRLGGGLGDRRRRRPRASGLALWLGSAAVVLASMSAGLAWPYRVRPVRAPPIVESAGFEALPPGSVVSAFPPGAERRGWLMLGQALHGYSFEVTAGYAIVPGRSGHGTEQPPPDPLQLLFAAGGFGTLSSVVSPTEANGVKTTIDRLHVRAVVVDRQSPGAHRVADVLTKILGAPTLHAGQEVGWILPPILPPASRSRG
jgi:hypothetical protein